MGRRRLIRNLVSKPSEVLQYMVDGLLKQSARPDFKVNMDSFGGRSPITKRGKITCFGCAATCTIQEIANKDIDCDHIRFIDDRAKALRFNGNDLRDFERVVDAARQGDLYALVRYLDIPYLQVGLGLLHPGYQLSTSTWKRQLGKVRRHIKALQEAGY